MNMSIQILLNNALTYIQAGEFYKANELLNKARALDQNNPDILRFLSVVAALQYDYDAALVLIDQVIALTPDNAIAHSNRGNILKELNRFEEALTSLDKAIALDPNYVEAYSNKGNVLQDLHRYDEALEWYDRAITLQPNYAEAYSNKGNALALLRHPDEAMYNYNKATTLNPDFIDAYWHKALIQLVYGDFINGWQNYESRWFKSNPVVFQNSTIPRLENAKNIRGKKILIWAEQGLGDTLQFCRYIELLHRLGGIVTFLLPSNLLSVLSQLEQFCTLTAHCDNCAEFDLHSPLLSLPLVFSTEVESVPAEIPYITANPEKVKLFEGRILSSQNMKVGVIWNGGLRVGAPKLWSVNKRRNIGLDQIAKLKEVAGVDFYSLQKGDPAESELRVRQDEVWPKMINYVHWLDDFSDTAALMQCLDLIISVDTSCAHLAGALGKPVWILNRYDSCWRWLHGRSDSPWYPTAKMYQQSKPGDWDEVIDRVKLDLNALALKHLHQ